MKQIIFVFVAFISSITLLAQSPRDRGNQPARLSKRFLVDSSYMECIFSHKVFDPLYDETREDFKILEIGKNKSKYGDYGAYKIDSIVEVDYPNGLTKNEYHKLSLSLLPSWEATIKEFAPGLLKTFDSVFMDHYVIEEQTPKIKWIMTKDSEIICGYRCKKATSSFRGRSWTAWYCPDISVDNGPWKFGGLPGLILKIESDDNEHKFEVLSVRKSKRNINLIGWDYFKTSRERFNKELEDYNSHPAKFLSGNPMAPKDKDGNLAVSEFRRLFFNPIELE